MAEEIVLNTTQRRFFDYITEFGSITTLQAFVDLGESRLSARIWELRNKGIPIKGEKVKVKKRFGESRCVKKYWIGEENGNQSKAG